MLASVGMFMFADFDAPTSFLTAGFLHLFFAGFVISIILGALYQLASVILNKPFFSVRGAFANMFLYFLGVASLAIGMFTEETVFLHAGATLASFALLFFAATYLLTFAGVKAWNVSSVALGLGGVFLAFGATLGFLLVMFASGVIELDFDIVLRYHVYFVLGFLFFVVVGSVSVLLPMFSLSHGVNFTLSKAALVLYLVAGAFAWSNYGRFVTFAALLCFGAQVFLILVKRARKAIDYWNFNVFLALAFLAISMLAFEFGSMDFAAFSLTYGALYALIAGNLYKIASFLVWYHYVSPFVGKREVPLLENMVIKKMAFVASYLNIAAIVIFALGFGFAATACMGVSAILLGANLINIFRFIRFGVEDGQN